MRARPLVVLLIGAGTVGSILCAACGKEEGLGLPATQTVRVHGQILPDTGYAPPYGEVTLRITTHREGRLLTVTSTSAYPNNSYSISFLAHCDPSELYNLQATFYLLRFSPQKPPLSGSSLCRTPDWPVDIYVTRD